MKYMQILLYYVQDASLFQVHLPNGITNKDSILVKMLQFSPEVLTDVYKEVTELCLSSGSALIKCFFIALFGPCVISIICLVYLIQVALSRCLW